MTSIMNSNLLKAAVLCIGAFIGYLIGQGHTAGAPTITDTASVVNSAKIPDVKEFSLQIANRKIVAGSGNIEVREGDVVNLPQLGLHFEVIEIPGHTAGHTAFHLSSGKDQMMISNDAAYVPALNAAQDGWHGAYDQDGPLAKASRRRILDRVIADKMMICGAHFPFPGAATIQKDGDGYALISMKA